VGLSWIFCQRLPTALTYSHKEQNSASIFRLDIDRISNASVSTRSDHFDAFLATFSNSLVSGTCHFDACDSLFYFGRKYSLQDREFRMLENLAGWLINFAQLLGALTSPICGLIAVFIGLRMFFSKRSAEARLALFCIRCHRDNGSILITRNSRNTYLAQCRLS
jgi:hypothetical protein